MAGQTPEKQLLDLIEKPEGQKTLQTASLKYHTLSFLSLTGLAGRIAFLKKNMVSFFKEGSFYQADLRTVNRLLKACVVVLALYFLANLGFSFTGLRKDLNLKVRFESRAKATAGTAISMLKSLTYYLEKPRQRDLFKMGSRLPLETANAAAKGPSARILEATKDFQLVGISWSHDPDVMIEDTANQRTLFLKRGQTFGNNVKINAVFKDRVVLGFEGEEVELR